SSSAGELAATEYCKAAAADNSAPSSANSRSTAAQTSTPEAIARLLSITASGPCSSRIARSALRMSAARYRFIFTAVSSPSAALAAYGGDQPHAPAVGNLVPCQHVHARYGGASESRQRAAQLGSDHQHRRLA